MTDLIKTLGTIKPKIKKLLSKFKTKTGELDIPDMLYKLLLSWLLISAFYIANNDISFIEFYYFKQIKLSVFICAVAILWLILCKVKNKNFISILMIGTIVVYGVLATIKYSDFSWKPLSEKISY